jgi:hypothetical protein
MDLESCEEQNSFPRGPAASIPSPTDEQIPTRAHQLWDRHADPKARELSFGTELSAC